jgi:diacylglycerol kinase (ATP)
VTIAVLVNPVAGRGRRQALIQAAVDRLKSAGPLDVISPDSAAKAETLLKDSVARGVQAVVAVGGDGTVHLAVQAVAETGVPLGIIPAGTGNDMATCFGLPTAPDAAADVVIEALAAQRKTSFDLGRISTSDGQTRWYGGVLAAGFDAIVNERGNTMRWPRGRRRYDLAILWELARLRPRHYRITFDGKEEELDAVLLAVGNIPSYGGAMRIAPGADPTDGLLDVVWAEPISRTTLMRIKPKVYKGTHIEHPKVRQRRVTSITIDAPGIVCYADGERISALPVTLTAVPGALSLLR